MDKGIICSLLLSFSSPVDIVKTVNWLHHSGSSFTLIPKNLSRLSTGKDHLFCVLLCRNCVQIQPGFCIHLFYPIVLLSGSLLYLSVYLLLSAFKGMILELFQLFFAATTADLMNIRQKSSVS